MALVGEEADRMPLESMLDHVDANLHRAVAQGFAFGKYAQPLLDRANDANIYPFALLVLERDIIDLDGFIDPYSVSRP